MSRTALIRDAVGDYLSRRRPRQPASAFGLWGDRETDYLNGVPAARDELNRFDDKAISIVTWMEVLAGATPRVEAATPGRPRWIRIRRTRQRHRRTRRHTAKTQHVKIAGRDHPGVGRRKRTPARHLRTPGSDGWKSLVFRRTIFATGVCVSGVHYFQGLAVGAKAINTGFGVEAV